MISNPSLTETILFDFDGMNVNEMNELKNKIRLCVFAKRNDFIFDV